MNTRHLIASVWMLICPFTSVSRAQGAPAGDDAAAHVRIEAVLWRRAQAAGDERSPTVATAADDARRRAAIEAYVARQITPVEPTDEALRARYQDILSGLGSEEFRPRILLHRDRAVIDGALRQLATGGDFAALARLHSQAPSAARGGDLGWVSFPLPVREGRTQGLPREVAYQLIRLAAGEVGDPIRLGEAWLLVKLEHRRKVDVPDFERARPVLRRLMLLEQMQQKAGALSAAVRLDAGLPTGAAQ